MGCLAVVLTSAGVLIVVASIVFTLFCFPVICGPVGALLGPACFPVTENWCHCLLLEGSVQQGDLWATSPHVSSSLSTATPRCLPGPGRRVGLQPGVVSHSWALKNQQGSPPADAHRWVPTPRLVLPSPVHSRAGY